MRHQSQSEPAQTRVCSLLRLATADFPGWREWWRLGYVTTVSINKSKSTQPSPLHRHPVSQSDSIHPHKPCALALVARHRPVGRCQVLLELCHRLAHYMGRDAAQHGATWILSWVWDACERAERTRRRRPLGMAISIRWLTCRRGLVQPAHSHCCGQPLVMGPDRRYHYRQILQVRTDHV